ncbi:hypothetical protein SLS62_000764 [Diatrype stigma]|uniref:Uncharacterized protein n=1 Tax=Diatrype stigma TaxID=117547 RepID=A0AAN9UX76_9PEZI
MSRYYPHPAYAEDQPLARTILMTHVETRAVTTGTLIGGGLFAYRSIRGLPHTVAVAAKTAPPLLRLGVPFLRTTGINVLWTMGLTSAGLAARMYGREDIEWRDRAWRLLENRGQLETDDWTYPGMAAGLAAWAGQGVG